MLMGLLRTFSALVGFDLLSLDFEEEENSELADPLKPNVFSDFPTLPETHPDVGPSSHSSGGLEIDDPALHDYDAPDAFETHDLFDCDFERSPRSPFSDHYLSDSPVARLSPPSSPMSEDSERVTPTAFVTNNNMICKLEHPPPGQIESTPHITPKHLAPALITSPPYKPQQQNIQSPRFPPRTPSNSVPTNMCDSFPTLQANHVRLASSNTSDGNGNGTSRKLMTIPPYDPMSVVGGGRRKFGSPSLLCAEDFQTFTNHPNIYVAEEGEIVPNSMGVKSLGLLLVNSVWREVYKTK